MMIHDDDVAVVTVLLIATKKIVTVAKPEKIPSLSHPLKSNPSPLTPSPPDLCLLQSIEEEGR